MWYVAEIDREFIERMEDLLELYARPPVLFADKRAEPVKERSSGGVVKPRTNSIH